MQVYDPNINYCSSKSNEYRQFKKLILVLVGPCTISQYDS